MNYLNYPKKLDTPNRKNRKSARNKVFQANKKMNKLARRPRSAAR